jgi:LuxR family glucitol operon transcriptional activator
MSINTTRLTLYAVLSAIEDDLRQVILDYLNDHLKIEEVLDVAAIARVSERAQKDGAWKLSKLEDVIYYLDLGDLCPCINRNKPFFPPDFAKFVQLSTSTISDLVPVRNRVAHGRPLLASDFAQVMDTANSLIGTGVFWSTTIDCLKKLEHDPGFVLQLKLPSREERRDLVSHNLPDPDFDETGFVGRQHLVKTIKDLISGPFPIISLIGVGGLGKTALALQVAYSLLENNTPDFDAIVWVTAKSATLSNLEIRRIDGAIVDSLGLMRKAVAEIGGDETTNSPIDELVELLATFRVLLVLDNLETVLDQNVKDFFERLPQGSKVLTTSRIGIGAFDRPLQITPFEPQDSVTLLRKMAVTRGIQPLSRLSNTRLEEFAKRMGNNPLHMKWFVLGIQSGRTPEQILSQPQILLEFCMQNVFEHLSLNARKLLEVMQTIPHGQSLPELAYYCALPAIELRNHQNELVAANMVTTSTGDGISKHESIFSISDFTRKYLQRFHPIHPDRQKELLDKRRSLVAEKERLSSQILRPFDAFSIETRSIGDVAIAKYLSVALRECRAGNLEASFKNAEIAKEISPDFHEVYRVLAWIKNKAGDIIGAKEDYEHSIELFSKSAKTHYFYAQFLLRQFDDLLNALSHLKIALSLAPDAVEVLLEIARCNLYQQEFEESDRVSRSIAHNTACDERQRTIAFDLLLQGKYRYADHKVNNHQPTLVLGKLDEFIEVFEKIPVELLDERMLEHARKLKATAEFAMKSVLDANWRATVESRIRSLEGIVMKHARLTKVSGTIKTVKWDRNFGFITDQDQVDYYFHRRSLVDADEWSKLFDGTPVTFLTSENARSNDGQSRIASSVQLAVEGDA